MRTNHKLKSHQVDHLRAILRDTNKCHLWDCVMRILLGDINYSHQKD